MDSSLPTIPADLWPHALAAQGSRPKGRLLTVEIPGMSENLLLSVLARAIHLEMRAAGEWAARTTAAADTDFPSAKEFSCFRAENAARLLALYVAVFATAQYIGSSDQTPEALKASASRSYQYGLRDERTTRQTRSPGYNEALYRVEKSATTTELSPKALIATPRHP